MMTHFTTRRIASIAGFSGVLFGAFGAHVLRGVLQRNGTAEIWETGIFYHLVHSVVLLTMSGWNPPPHRPFVLLLGGTIVFSGSLYLLALTNLRWLGAVTPIGGLGLLAGWILLALQPGSQKKEGGSREDGPG